MIRIISDSRLNAIVKKAYEKGLNTKRGIDDQMRKMDESHLGTIMSGYDMKKDLDEILKRKGV